MTIDALRSRCVAQRDIDRQRTPISAVRERHHQYREALGDAAIDAFRAARIDRRTLLRYAATLGLTILADTSPLVHAAAAGERMSAKAPSVEDPAATARAGATIRVANLTPVGAVDPLTASDPASICLLSQTCEYLLNDDGDTLTLRPSLARSWTPDPQALVWTFDLRPGVRFHDGQEMVAADVVATFDRLTDPQRGSAALSAFKGVLSKGGTRAIDSHTVAFHLDTPNANFPYYVSSDNYNAAILPARFIENARGAALSGQPAGERYEQHFIGTGPFRLAGYTPRVGASFVRNDAYWGPRALPERVVFSFYADQQSQILALQGGDADVIVNLSIQGGRALVDHPAYRVQSVRSSSHRQVHMRCDAGPFADKRVRRALALSIDRAAIVKGVFLDRAQQGNDSPFAPVFPSSPPASALPQRHQDLMRARALLDAARGSRASPAGDDAYGARAQAAFNATLATEKFMEMPDYAVLVQNAAKSIGIDLRLRIESQSAYYGAATPGRSDWLDATIGITDYGHRGVPNVFLNATLSSQGSWNAAHFRSQAYDRLLARYNAALDLDAQRQAAVDIGTLLLDETPVIIAYFFDALVATRANVRDVRFTAITQLSLAGAWLA